MDAKFIMEQSKRLTWDTFPEKLPEYSEKEKKVAEFIFERKKLFLEKSYKKSEDEFLTRKKFAEAKGIIEGEEIFTVLKKFPKGGLLHIHQVAAVPSKYLYDLIKNRDDGYIYAGEETIGREGYPLQKYGKMLIIPEQKQRDMEKEGWRKVKDLREEQGAEKFDKLMLSRMYFTAEDEQRSSEKRWIKFQSIFPLLMYFFHIEIYEEYYMKMVETFMNDGIFYAEISTMLGSLYDNTDKTYSPEEHLLFLKKLDDKAKVKYPGWLGAKLRHEDHKKRKPEQIAETMDSSIYLQTKYPNFCVGFDLVGEEDTSPYLESFLPLFCKKIKDLKPNERLQFIFHAGESNRMSNNIRDALLLNTKRIGHGFNLYSSKNTQNLMLKKNQKEKKNICLEICPCSNKGLGYVYDARSHPLSHYMRMNIPFVISSDDPGIFGYEGVTHDYFFVFVGNMNYGLEDLNVLKHLAKNSIKYSLMSEEEKKMAFIVWEERYQKFLDEIIKMM